MILLVDANNLAYRNFYAQNLKTKSGQNTGMIYGFINSMLTVIKELNPDTIIYVWDPPGGSDYRKTMYKLYKANRDAQTPDFYEEKNILVSLLQAMSTIQIAHLGVESDDILGYLSTIAYKNEETVIYSNDKDVLQTMSTGATVYLPDKGLLRIGSDGKIPIKEQGKTIFIRPDQVPDYKALVGDPSDNYPGIPGFGIGAAINYFALNDRAMAIANGTANLSNQRSNVLSAVIQNRGMIPLWLDLATLNMTEGAKAVIPERSTKNVDMVNALFDHLEFNQFKALGEIVYKVGGK